MIEEERSPEAADVVATSWLTRPLSPRSELGAVAAVAVLVVIAVGVFVSRSFFFYDDVLFFNLARESRFGWDYLSRSAFGHFIPSFWFFNKVLARFDPVPYELAAGGLMGAHLASALAAWRAARRLVGPTLLAVGAMAVFGLSIILLNTSLWWSGAIGLLPSTALNLVTLAVVVHWDRTRRARTLALAALAYLGAMTFWEKSLLVAAYSALLLVLVADAGLPVRQRVQKAVARWPLWLMFTIVGGTYLALYVAGDYVGEAPGTRPPGSMYQFLGLSAFEGLFPGLLGVRYPEVEILGQVWLGWVLPAAVVIGLVLWTSWRAAKAREAWLFFLVTYLLNQAVLGFGRIGYGGIHLGREYRYQLDNLILFVIAATVAIGAALSSPQRRAGPPKGGAAARLWWLRPALGIALAALLLPSWIRSADQVIYESPGPDARAFVDNFERTLADLRRQGDDRPILPSTVPATVVTDLFYPYNRHDFVLPILRSDLEFATNTSDGLVLDAEGNVRPARFTPIASLELGEPACVPADGGSASAVMSTQDLPVAGWYVQVLLSAPSTGSAAVNLLTPDGPRSLLGTLEEFELEGSELFVAGISAAAEGVQVQVTGPAGTCIASIAIGGVT